MRVDAVIPQVVVRDEGFSAQYISQSIADPISIEVGETVDVIFKFKNIGTKTWDAHSKNYVSAYTMEPRYRSSDFFADNWTERRQSAKIDGVIKPGQIGELHLKLKAPDKTGHYVEKFWLAADAWSWLKGGYFYAVIDVVEKQTPKEIASDIPAPSDEEDTHEDTTTTVSIYKAKRLLLNKKEITARGGEQIKIILGFQNLGEATWDKYAIIANEPSGLAISRALSFADNSWKNNVRVIESDIDVEQWGITKDTFIVRAPSLVGDYTLEFQLEADGRPIHGLRVEIPVHVTEDAPLHYQVPQFNNHEDVVQARLETEPYIRVGLWKNPDNNVAFVSADDNYIVYAGDEQQGILTKNSPATISYVAGTYAFASSELNITSHSYIRLVPETNAHAIFELTNYSRLVSWKGPYNFNSYRGGVEYRLTNDGLNNLYIINELLYEDYVAGIAETSNASPIEYIKALLTAARTYAYYVAEHSTKHDKRFFDVVATTGDQLYLGYRSEALMPRVKQAQDATRGYMISYNNDIVITPYFGNSDGRTRDWTDVWGGTKKPWLVSVPAIYDKRDNKKMYGHGVGMSARDAAYMAEEENKKYEDILKYYYSGVEVVLMYK